MIPFFSVIIPTFNRAHLLSRAIDSVRMQTFLDFELIVVDDGSTDNTIKVLQQYLFDERIIYYAQVNQGVCAARNYGASKAKGKFIVFLDSDDFVDQNWLQHFYHSIEASQAELVFCYSIMMDDVSGKTMKIGSFDSCTTRKGKVRFSSLAGTYCINESIFKDSGGLNVKLKYAENTEFINRVLFKFNPTVGYVKEFLVTFGNSLEPKTRRSKFSQSLKKESLELLISINTDFWLVNRAQLVSVIRRIIVAHVVLSEYRAALKLLLKKFHYSPSRFIRLLLLLAIGPIYRLYLLNLGYRP